MPSRFQTRLAVSVSLVIALTVVGMTFLGGLFTAGNLVKQDREKAILLHTLLQKSIENVSDLPSRIRERRPPPPPPDDGSTNQPPRELSPDGARPWHVRRFGIGRRGDLHIALPGERAMARRSDLLVQGIADCFVVDTQIERILVIQADGTVAAKAAMEGEASGPSDEQIAALCQSFLANKPQKFLLHVVGNHVGVVTSLKDPKASEPRALYVQYHKSSAFTLLEPRILYGSLLGMAMIALGILLSITLSRRLSKPVHQLANAVQEFGKGNLAHRIDLPSDVEFRALGRSFNQMACSIQAYTTKLEQETKRREGLESELRIAAELQRSLLPTCPPCVPGLELNGWSQPSAQVGGDFYDYLELDPCRLAVMIGDATGKGLPAALLITECWSIIAAFAEEPASPSALLSKTNNALCKRLGDSGQFVTLFLMVIDASRGELSYSVAGHNPPFLIGADSAKTRRLTSRQGFPLGLFPNCRFEDTRVRLAPSDTILLYSDGLTDAPGPDTHRFGDDRLMGSLHGASQKPLEQLINEIRTNFQSHIGAVQVYDDVTVVGVRYNEPPLHP